MSIRATLSVAMLFGFCAPALAAETHIQCGQMINVRTLEILENQTIRVNANKIVAVEAGFAPAPAEINIIDLKTSTCMPGLMDMHVHLTSEYSSRSNIERFTLDGPDFAIRAVANADKTLMAGFTTVRDLGDKRFGSVIALRKAIDSGIVPGPRVFAAGKSIATTGGHADPTNGGAQYLDDVPSPEGGVIDGVAEARKAVRQRYKNGADLIKITATGGVLSVAKSGQNPQFQKDELEAIITTAHEYGMKVAAHAHGTEGMKRAAAAGIDSIEHGTFMTDDVMRLMKRKGTWYVPTILAGNWVGEKAKIDGFFPELVRPKAAAIGPQISDTFARAYKAGVKIAFGTDTGVSAHGDNAQEFELMVAAGMPPLEAIRSATLYGAQLVGIEDKAGTLEPGKWADIVAVPGNPVDDISLMTKVNFVMKDGTVYKQ